MPGGATWLQETPETTRRVFEVPPAVLAQASKCGNEYSCLETGCCGGSPMCAVEAAHGDNVLRVLSAEWPRCSYHLDFGGARFCVCPVRSAIYRQQAR